MRLMFICTVVSYIQINSLQLVHAKFVVERFEKLECVLDSHLRKEIASYQPTVNQIIDYVVNGDFKAKTYSELENFVDIFGSRIAGGEILEKAIDYMVNITKAEHVDDVTTEHVEVSHWVRGTESVVMLQPRYQKIAVLGLGGSVSTPTEGITSEVIVVQNFDELKALPDEDVKGKIVLYNEQYTSYGESVVYRSQGASKAAAKGAVASLVRSVTPFSIYSPHTGMQTYETNITKIPTAAITVEDADLISRLCKRKQKVVLRIILINHLQTKISRNTLIDLKGTEKPEKLVIVSGHIDSWDVGQGAMDDGGGMMISWAVPVILKKLNLTTKRTIRSIFWTGEEMGLEGAIAYEKKHSKDNDKINFIMESDEGTFKPLGLAVAGSHSAKCIIAEILKLFGSINATKLEEEDSPGSDITVIVSKGVPGAALLNENEKYFWFHHTDGDTINVENTDELDLCAAFWTAVAYIVADLSVDIPRS